MLAPEQLDAIIASRVALIKSYYTQGEIKRKDPSRDRQTRTPWPEFWPGYNEAVKERDELSVHIQYGVFPEHLFRVRYPNQTDKEYEYIKGNFRQTTLPNYGDYENTIRRALHESNWRLKFTEEGGDFSEYYYNKVGELGSFTKWFQGILPKIKTLDAMGLICTMPKSLPLIEGVSDDGEPILLMDPDTMVEPQPNYFPVEKVWGYEHGIWYCLLTEEKSEVKFGGRTVKEGIVMWIVDDMKCYRVAQTGEAVKLTFDVTVHFDHEQGYPPCIFLMGIPTLVDGRLVWQSNYLAAKPAFDTVLVDTTSLMMIKASSTYPIKVILGGDCEYVAADMMRCVGGNLRGVGENNQTVFGGQCPSCKGSGTSLRLGPLGVVVVKDQKRGDGTPPSVHDAMTYVEPTSTTMDFLAKEIVTWTESGRAVMHLSSEAPIQGGDVKTATQSGVDVKAQMAFIKPISDQIFTIVDFTIDCMAKQRYGSTAEQMYELIPATTFDLRTESDYLQEFVGSAELPPSLRQGVLEAYVHTKYSGNPEMLDAFQAIILADRLFAVSWDEIAAMTDKKAWEVALHNEALSIYERLARDAKFENMDRFEKADAMQAEAQKQYPEKTEQPNDIARRLVENINPPVIEEEEELVP